MALLNREKWLCYLKFPSVIQRLFEELSESKKHEQNIEDIRQNLLLHCKAETKQPVDQHSLECLKTVTTIKHLSKCKENFFHFNVTAKLKHRLLKYYSKPWQVISFLCAFIAAT